MAEPGRDEAESKLIPPWAYFSGKSNSAPVLYEKAKIVTYLIDMSWSDALILAGPIRASRVRWEEDQARSIILETAALLIRIVDEIALSALGAESSDGFMEALIEFVGQDLQGRGIQAAGACSWMACQQCDT